MGPHVTEEGWKKLWNTLVSPRVLVFYLLVRERKIITLDKLKRCGYVLVNGCPLCLDAEEIANHLFIHYQFARKVWCKLLGRFGIVWVMPSSTTDLFIQWRLIGVLAQFKILRNFSLFVVVWKIWLEKNN